MKKLLMTLFVATFAFSFVGCKSDSPSKTVDAMFTALQKGDFLTACGYMQGFDQATEEERQQAADMIGAVAGDTFSDMTYEILEETIAEDGQSATVKVHMTTKDDDEDNDMSLVKTENGWRVEM